MATTLEIINGISQVVSNTYDGALDDKGEPIKIGLRREEGHPIHDSRVMDGFGVKFHGDILCIYYHAEIQLKEVYSGTFEDDTESMINDISKYLKKEYKKVTGDTLTLTSQGDINAIVQNTSKVRVWVQASKEYKIGGMSGTDPVKGESKDSVDAKFKSFLELGGFGSRPKNDTRKKA
jgi:hypothetical protein